MRVTILKGLLHNDMMCLTFTQDKFFKLILIGVKTGYQTGESDQESNISWDKSLTVNNNNDAN